jgi:hypothetical protein
MLAMLGSPAADAGCPGSQLLDATFSYLVSNPNWGGVGGTETCGQFGCYATDSDPPVSADMKGVYWHLGHGDPALGVGSDSGLFAGGFGPNEYWLKQRSSTTCLRALGTPEECSGVPFANGMYHYPAWISLDLGEETEPHNTTGPPVTWSSPDADGCGPANPPETECTCMMLTDEWNGAGYFATLSARSDPLGNTNIDPFPPPATGGVISLAEIPRPRITGSVRNATSGDVTFQVTHDALTGGTYPKDSCGTCLGGFKVFGQIVARGSAAPTDRSIGGWIELSDGTGAAQPTTALGGTATVRAECNPTVPQDLYLAIAIVGEGATPFLTTHVSRNSTLVHCGSTLAEPDGPRNRPDERQGRGERDVRPRTR